jgi:hypothetical protein
LPVAAVITGIRNDHVRPFGLLDNYNSSLYGALVSSPAQFRVISRADAVFAYYAKTLGLVLTFQPLHHSRHIYFQ